MTFKLNTKHTVFIVKAFIHSVSLGLLCNLYWSAITDRLGADPVEAVLNFTGIGAFNLLILSLFISPSARFFKLSWLLKFRRLLGLYSFAYALFHLMSFLAFEVQFDFQLFINEIIKRPYITVGMLAFVTLLALAITSMTVLKRKMGGAWQKLHHMVYAALLLVGVHFYWSVKSDITEPSIYLIVSIILLLLRRDKFKRWFKKH
ncbi:protein-methionine-sulfoxide reductase heme-binding subunit MsrQ [Colwelliaceae bacterium 6441]